MVPEIDKELHQSQKPSQKDFLRKNYFPQFNQERPQTEET